MKRGLRWFIYLPSYTDAYLKTFPAYRKRHAASSTMSRLLKHPNVIAARAWLFASINGKIPRGERMPQSAHEIRRRPTRWVADSRGEAKPVSLPMAAMKKT